MRTIPAREQLPKVFLPESYEHYQTEAERMALGECVYIIVTGFTNRQVRVKVGHTKNVSRRLNEHRFLVPDAMVLATFSGSRFLEKVALETAKVYCSEYEKETFTFDYKKDRSSDWPNYYSDFRDFIEFLIEAHLHLGTRP